MKSSYVTQPATAAAPSTWTVYRAAGKAVRLGEVEATDEREAIAKAAEEFQTGAARLIAR